MSDVVLSTTESVTTVTTVNDVVEVAVTTNPVEVSASTAGVQGASYNQGDPIYVTVRNATGATLPKGTIVYISGANGNNVRVTPAIATSDATSARTLGWLSEAIANNALGFCQIEGYLEGLNTHGLTAGDQLYLSGTTAGAFTATKPQAPIHLVYVGVVTKVSTGDGHVFVKVQNGYELEELHDVLITNPVNNQVLTYDSATDLWINKVNAADGVTSITATAPLTGGTITSTGSIGLDQTALSITQSQVSGLVSDLAGKANLAGGNAFTGAQTVTGTVAGSRVLTVTGASGQSASFFEVLANAGNTLFRVNATGYGMTPLGFIGGGTTMATNARNTLYTAAAASIGLVIQGAASQTANILEIQSSAGSILSRFSSSGQLVSDQQTYIGSGAASIANTRLNVATGSASVVGQVIRGASGQTADLLQIQDNAGTSYLSVNNVGSLLFGTNSGSFLSGANGRVNVQLSGDNVGLTVRAFGSQTADLVKIQNSSGVDLVRVDSAGRGIFPTVLAGAFTTSQGAHLALQATAATNIGILVRGAASQSASLTEWLNSSGTVLTRIDASGQIVAPNTAGAISSGTFIIGSRNSGAEMTMVRQTAATSNPGANLARLYFRDGTNAGTLKLVVRAGAAGAETTILDNIPQ